MQKYAVLGNPIAHSLSPEIHQLYAKQFGIQLSYERILVAPGALASALQNFYNQGGCGVNITSPYKTEAFALMHELSEAATKTGAVNTITFLADGRMRGDNTDGIGLVRDLKNNQQVVLAQARIAILGAGGATQGILPTLLAEKPACIVLANRTYAKAEKLAQSYTDENLQACTFTDLASQSFDLIINATAAGVQGDSLQLTGNFFKDAVCYDLSYGSKAQEFLTIAKQQGASKCVDGLGMLIEQAAEAFYLWHGLRPDTRAVNLKTIIVAAQG